MQMNGLENVYLIDVRRMFIKGLDILPVNR
jgi:hypothetical protein